MDILEKKFNDDYLYRMRDEVLKELEKGEEFHKLSREVDALSSKFPIITDLFEGTHMEDAHELTKVERQAIRKYVELRSRMMEIHEFAHYYRGHGDCILHLSRCGFIVEQRKTGLSTQDMIELIYILDAYKALNTALFGDEVSLMEYEGYMGALGRIYRVIDNNIPLNMKTVANEILTDTSIEPEKRAKVLLQGEDN